MTDNIFITGRLVGGHPLEPRPVVDDSTKLPKLRGDGAPSVQTTVGVAVPKGTETNWSQTPWGAAIYNAALAGYPGGETQAPHFSWKVVDGDSTVPNREGKIPNQREGAPGHWILWCSTGIDVPCFHVGKYNPMEQIRNKNEIKPGDYCRVIIDPIANNVKGAVKTPGVYINPKGFELIRAGQPIQLGTTTDFAAAFGGSAAVLPDNALLDNAVAGPGPGPAQTNAAGPGPGPAEAAHDFLNNAPDAPPPAPGADAPPPAPERFNLNGKIYTREALTAANWTTEQINALPRA